MARLRHALGVDLGSTSTKVVALSLEDAAPAGTVIGSFATPSDGERLWREVARLLRSALETYGPPEAIGIASMAESGLPLGADDTPLTAVARWDRAGASRRVRALSRPDRERHFLATGVRLQPKTTWSLLDDVLRRGGVRDRFTRWVGVADWLLLRLTGVYGTDATLAGRTGLYPLAPDPVPVFAGELGLRTDQLPPVSPGPHPLRCPGLEAIGYPSGVPVLVAGHDHAVGAWGVGMRAPGHLVDSVGTAEAVTLGATGPVDRVEAFARATSVVRSVAGFEAVLAGSPASGRLVAAWRERHPDEPLPAAFEHPYDDLVAPYPMGRQAPAPDPGATLRSRSGRDPLDLPAQPLLEALAHQARWLAEAVTEMAGDPPERVTLVGAAVLANPAWAALKASLADLPTDVCTAEQPVAQGAALLASVRAGAAPADATLPTRPVAPLPDDAAEAYRRRQAEFVRFVTG